MIENAVQGLQECDRLRHDLSQLRYNPDLRKMLHNIETMLTEISKKEVICRQTRNISILETPLKQVNEAVDHLEKLILIAKIMD